MTNPEPADAGTIDAAMKAARTRIAAAVRAEAGRAGVKQVDIARAIVLPPSSVALRWRGVRSFAAEELAAVAALIGVPIGRLYAETDEPSPGWRDEATGLTSGPIPGVNA